MKKDENFFAHLNRIHLESMVNEDIFAAIQCREGGSDRREALSQLFGHMRYIWSDLIGAER